VARGQAEVHLPHWMQKLMWVRSSRSQLRSGLSSLAMGTAPSIARPLYTGIADLLECGPKYDLKPPGRTMPPLYTLYNPFLNRI
jgi:hypothetical protein